MIKRSIAIWIMVILWMCGSRHAIVMYLQNGLHQPLCQSIDGNISLHQHSFTEEDTPDPENEQYMAAHFGYDSMTAEEEENFMTMRCATDD